MVKKIRSIFMLLIILMTSFTLVYSVNDGSALISASMLSQNPDPAKAGDSVELRFSIENTGYSTSDDLWVSIEENYPFSVISNTEIYLGKLMSGQNNDNKQIVKFNVKLDKETVAGSHDLVLIIKDSRDNEKRFIFNIDVDSKDSVQILSIDKSVIKPGSQEELNFKIKNVGLANLKNLKFSLNSQDNVLLPVLSDNSFYIDFLNVGEELIIPFQVIASSNVVADLYSLNLKISYEDSLSGATKEVSTNAGIYIGGGTDFDVVFNDVSGEEYAFTIANIGANDVTSVKVTAVESDNWRVGSKKSDIIGNLNKGDYTTASFELTSLKGGDLDLKIEYTNTQGLRESVVKTALMNSNDNRNLNITTNQNQNANFAQANRGVNRNPMNNLATAGSSLANLFIKSFIGLVVIAGLFFGFRYYKKKKVSKK